MRLQDFLADTKRFLEIQGGCSSCPRKLKDFVSPTLRKSKIIVIDDTPSETDVEKQEGFSGKAGQVLRSAFRDVGINPDSDTSWSTTVHCRPPENKDPTDKEISCCMNQHVFHEVGAYPIVVLAGNIACNAFFPGHGQQVKGNLAYHPDFPNTRFYGMLHPAAIGYDTKRKEEFFAQVDRLGRINRGNIDAPFTLITGAEFRTRWAQFLEVSTLLSLDLETDRLESWILEGKVRSLAACSLHGDEVFSIEDDDPFWNEALQLLAKYCQNPEKQILGQNIGFDLVWLESRLNFKCDLKYIHDLQPLYYQLDGARYTSLKPLVSRALDGYRHLVCWPHLEKNKHHLKLYNAEDVHYPKLLFTRDFPRLRAKTQDLYLRVLGPSSLATARMTHAGIHFRSQAWEELNTEFAEAREREITAWEAESPDFHRRSYITEKGFRDLDYYLYEIKKYPVLSKTKVEEKPSTDDATIKELVRQGATELNHCLTIKNIDKRRSTYILAYPKLVAPDRRIHASYHTTRVATGRLSSSDPNMQNIPRPEEQWKNQIRWLFGSAPGNKMLFGDFSQIELRVAMSLARDPVGLEVYRTGGDIHIQTAKFILGDEPADPKLWKKKGTKWEVARTKAKSANFALLYDGTGFTVQQYAMNEFGLMMSNEDADRWHAGFFETYPALHPWHELERQKLRENKGYVESAVGHVWYYKDWDSADHVTREHEERAAINMTCQGPAAYSMTYLIYLCQQAFWKSGIRANGLAHAEVVQSVHDSLAVEVDEEQVDPATAIVRHSLQQVAFWIKDWFLVPLVLDMEMGTVWEGDDAVKVA